MKRDDRARVAVSKTALMAGVRQPAGAAPADIDFTGARAAIGRLLGRDTGQFTLNSLALADGESDAFQISGRSGQIPLTRH